MAQGRKVMIDMLLEYDESVDAAYLTVSDAAFWILDRPRQVSVPG